MTELSYAAIRRHKTRIKAALAGGVSLVLCLMFVLFSQATNNNQTRSNTLAIGGPWEFTSLEPSKQGYIYTRMSILETLLNVDAKGDLIAGLARSWQSSADEKTWTLTLQPNVLFQDGSPLNASAVVSALRFAQDKHGALQKAPIEAIRVKNPQQVEIVLSQPHTVLPALLAHYSTAILAPSAYDQEGKVTRLIGTGAYLLDTFEPPHKLSVKANPTYWGIKPSIEFAQYLTGHRAESRILQAKSGDADIVYSLNAAMLDQLKGSDQVTVHSAAIPRTLLLKLNAAHPFMNQVEARQALSLAINRPAIAEQVLHVAEAASDQIFSPSMGAWYLDQPQENHNLAKAAELLAGLGWQKDAQGWLVRDGQRFQLTLTTYADRPELTTVATALQDQWKRLGVELKVDVTNSSMIPSGHADNTLEVALIARNLGVIADPVSLIANEYTHGGGDWGAMNWHNPAVDQALERLTTQSDPEQAKRDAQLVASAIYQQKPVLSIAYYQQHNAVNARVKGFQFDPFLRDYFINKMELVDHVDAH
ncbi:ABC transporter substrate-binding protein [Marinomonas pollencensis]|uniref:Peptide/nickel transport system substrate-binding protein n=1 Tax=Marinomonas pollencensis TaxID=491954 RepID=A0A3E0DGX8_9GAMM|nr:ABC transporter substrate-binding protein [Marinomonas pollencensis]REG81968.1 peptide/nickel transport system substrate-binding protein [Marinomonas pollencensis]